MRLVIWDDIALIVTSLLCNPNHANIQANNTVAGPTDKRHQTSLKQPVVSMMTSWNRDIFRVTGSFCGEFIGHRWIPRTKCRWRGTLVFFFIWALNKRLNKQPWGWWFETPSLSLIHYWNGPETLCESSWLWMCILYKKAHGKKFNQWQKHPKEINICGIRNEQLLYTYKSQW